MLVTEKPLISVIIPYYATSHPEWLLDAIASVRAQTYKNVEIVVVNDCSPGPSLPEITQGCDFDRLICIEHKSNRGTSAAKNTALASASGSYVVPLDYDDLLTPEFISVTLQALSGSSFGGVYTQMRCFQDWNCVLDPDINVVDVLSGYSSINTMLYKREVFDSTGGYNEAAWQTDVYLLLSAFEQGWQFGKIHKPLMKYRKHSQGKSNRNRRGAMAKWIEAYPELYKKHAASVMIRQHERLCSLWDEMAGYEHANRQLVDTNHELTQKLDSLLRDKLHDDHLGLLNRENSRRRRAMALDRLEQREF